VQTEVDLHLQLVTLKNNTMKKQHWIGLIVVVLVIAVYGYMKGWFSPAPAVCRGGLYTFQCNDSSAYIGTVTDPNLCKDGTTTPVQLACANN
jgi:hypothetical protein